jgi:hypothetical protein
VERRFVSTTKGESGGIFLYGTNVVRFYIGTKFALTQCLLIQLNSSVINMLFAFKIDIIMIITQQTVGSPDPPVLTSF